MIFDLSIKHYAYYSKPTSLGPIFHVWMLQHVLKLGHEHLLLASFKKETKEKGLSISSLPYAQIP